MNLKKHFVFPAIFLIYLLTLGVFDTVSASATDDIAVEPSLTKKIKATGSAGYMIYFREKPALTKAFSMNRKERGEHVVNSLQNAAQSAQTRVRAYLDTHRVPYKSFWIDNIIVVENSDSAVLDALLRFPEIESIKARRTLMLFEPEEQDESGVSAIVPMAGVEPNIAHVKADQVWALGITGSGVVVGSIDTGVRYTHQALVNQYRGNLGDGTFEHNYNWFDPYGAYDYPVDGVGHGTHTMGTAVGSDGTNQIGMAPGAEWISCRGCSSTTCSETALLACAEFMLAPTDLNGENPDPAKRPNVVNNSWGDCGQTYDGWYRTVVDNWQAAGIYPVFSNGNASNCGYTTPPACNTVGNPGRYGNVLAVGSTGQSNGKYATHSNLGPTDDPDAINPNGYASIKPQVAAPGVSIRSSVNTANTTYASYSGTSMSAPHVVGLIALMLQAAPCLTYSQAETIIEQTAIMNTAGLPAACSGEGPGRLPNQATGWGEIDALAAVNAALGMCGPIGTLTGTVTDASTNKPVASASVRLTDSRIVTTSTSGQYMILLPPGTYSVTVAAFGYDTVAATSVVIEDNMTTTQDFSLTQTQRVTVSGTVIDGSGTGWPLYAAIHIVKTPYFSTTVMTDPVTGRYSVELFPEMEFAFTVSAAGYYDNDNATITTGTVPLTQDFTLTQSNCTALGYGGGAPRILTAMSQRRHFPPAGRRQM